MRLASTLSSLVSGLPGNLQCLVKGKCGLDYISKAMVNRPVSYSNGWTGSSMKWRLMRANKFAFEKICPLEYETGLFINTLILFF